MDEHLDVLQSMHRSIEDDVGRIHAQLEDFPEASASHRLPVSMLLGLGW
jgi:hypothetical protein